jgi:hypothetical protein
MNNEDRVPIKDAKHDQYINEYMILCKKLDMR